MIYGVDMTKKDDKNGYYDFFEAVDDIKNANGVVDTALSTVGMVGKMGFNVAKFALTDMLPSILEKQANVIINHSDTTSEQKENAEQVKSSIQEMRSKKKK